MNKRSPLFGHSQLSYYVPMVQIRSSKIVIYNKYQGNTNSSKMLDAKSKLSANFNAENIKPYSGNLTTSSKKRLGFALDMLWQVSQKRTVKKWHGIEVENIKHHLSFITLTIPDQVTRVTGKEGYEKLLEPFIQWLKRRKKVKNYVWKAELQQPNDFFGNPKLCKGQLHYHIILPNYLDKSEIRAKWNYLLYTNGLMNDYINKTGNENPPSTWVGGLNKAKSGEYLLKEITKGIVSDDQLKNKIRFYEKDLYLNGETLENIKLKLEIKEIKQRLKNADSIGGKVWGCSENLQPKKIKDKDGFTETKGFFTTELTEELEKSLHDLNIFYQRTGDWEIRSYVDGENDDLFVYDDNNKIIFDQFGNPKQKEQRDKRFEILSMPDGYMEKLLDYKIFTGFDANMKPIYTTGLEEYKKHLKHFGSDEIIKETAKRKYIPLSKVMIDSKGEFIYKKKLNFEKSILQT